METRNRAMLVWHRRCGKDIATLNFMIWRMCQKIGTYYYFFPTFRQARSVIWDGLDEEGNRLIHAFPKDIIDGKPNETQMKVRLKNGSVFQLVGTDNYDAIAGTNPIGCVFSEYSLQDPICWKMIVSPILRKNKGWAVFNGTPRGKNHQWELDCLARENPDDWFYSKLTNDDTHLFTEQEIEKERLEKSEEIIQQEYYCSYERGVEGSFYGRLVEKARQQQRIGAIHYEPRSTVSTFWDIGYGDSTSIIFAQTVGTEFRIIDYYESQGEGMGHYVKVLQNKPYVYGSHYLPHDAGSGSIQTGTTLQHIATDLGLKTIVLPRDNLETGIEQARTLLSSCYIDSSKCKNLIKALESYHKKFNDKFNVYSQTPVHDWSSHAADAFRYTAVARNLYGSGTNALSPEKIIEMRQRNLGW